MRVCVVDLCNSYFPKRNPGLFPAHFASSFMACARENNPICENNLYCLTAKNCEAPLKPAGNRPVIFPGWSSALPAPL